MTPALHVIVRCHRDMFPATPARHMRDRSRRKRLRHNIPFRTKVQRMNANEEALRALNFQRMGRELLKLVIEAYLEARRVGTSQRVLMALDTTGIAEITVGFVADD